MVSDLDLLSLRSSVGASSPPLYKLENPIFTHNEKTLYKGVASRCLPMSLAFDHTRTQSQLLGHQFLPKVYKTTLHWLRVRLFWSWSPGPVNLPRSWLDSAYCISWETYYLRKKNVSLRSAQIHG